MTQILCERPRHTSSNLTSVDPDHSNDFRGSASQKTFIGGVDIMSLKSDLLYGNTSLLGQLNHTISCDSFQDARVSRRGFEDSTFHDEDIVAGTFGDITLMVKHQRFFASGVSSFDLGEDIVQVIEGLDPRAEAPG